jgi:transcriptional regulator with XRE-family HTH domain
LQIGGRIARARTEAGLTQQQLAERTGVTLRAVAWWESGDFNPGGDRIGLVAQATGRPVAWFFETDEVAA